jgi:hypothetical protein
MLSFLQSVTALIGLDKLSSGFAGGKALGRHALSRVEHRVSLKVGGPARRL